MELSWKCFAFFFGGIVPTTFYHYWADIHFVWFTTTRTFDFHILLLFVCNNLFDFDTRYYRLWILGIVIVGVQLCLYPLLWDWLQIHLAFHFETYCNLRIGVYSFLLRTLLRDCFGESSAHTVFVWLALTLSRYSNVQVRLLHIYVWYRARTTCRVPLLI